MKFSDIPGLSDIKTRLIDSVKQNHIAHAQLFLGKTGALNLPLALAYAMYLHCQNRGEADACGTCAACTKSLKYIHPDTNFVFPFRSIPKTEDAEKVKAETLKQWRTFLLTQSFDGVADWITVYEGDDKPASISVETSREIIRTLSLKPFESRFKIMIIWQPEMMHAAASNGILKILEEPPANTVFLLISNAAEQLLPTVISRTQQLYIPLLGDADLDTFLKSKPELSESRRKEIVQLAEGNMSLAIKLMDTEENHYSEHFADWMRACYKRDYARLLGLSDDFHELDRLNQKNILQYGSGMIRETLLHASGAQAISRIKSDETKFVSDFSKIMSVEKIDIVNQLLTDAQYHLDRNGSAKMIFLDLSLTISKTINP